MNTFFSLKIFNSSFVATALKNVLKDIQKLKKKLKTVTPVSWYHFFGMLKGCTAKTKIHKYYGSHV